MADRKRVIIIGAGFAGLDATTTLSRYNLDIVLIDRNNFHTFTPLLYQVATCGLDPSSIAYPVRSIFRNQRNVHFLMGEVQAIDTQQQIVTVDVDHEIRQEHYDYLLIASGSITNHFGQANIEKHTFGLKNLEDALILRQHILKLFERAAWTSNQAERTALTTFVVVGGGATGLETAGALYELYNHVLKQEYRDHEPALKATVILLEASDKLLAPYTPHLQQSALQQLQTIGVDVRLNTAVQDVSDTHVALKDGTTIPTHTLIWAAGVKASPVAQMVGVELQRGGRIPVKPTLEVIGLENVYAVGDIAYLLDDKGEPYAQVIQVAKQQGHLAAQNILKNAIGEPQMSFVYNDFGIMATIGRNRAVAWLFYKVQLTGYIAWLGWLFLHLVTLMGFRNRISVFISWVWNYLTYDRSVRLAYHHQVLEKEPAVPNNP
jgi:NADH:ubiquinone reductase (H+-translocating)